MAFILMASIGLDSFGQKSGYPEASWQELEWMPKKKRKTYRDTVWTIAGYKSIDDNCHKKWRFDFNFDARQTLVSNASVKLAGLRIGLEHRRVHRFGIGFYNLGNGVYLNSLSEVSPNIDYAYLNLGYASIYYERVLYFGRKAEWSVAGHLGRGQITGNYRYKGSEEIFSFTKEVKPAEVSTLLYYHFTHYFSVGMGVGYRYMRSTPQEVRPIYNAPVAILRLRFRFIRLIRGHFNPDIKQCY